MRFIATLWLFLMGISPILAQDFWKNQAESRLDLPAHAKRQIIPQRYEVLALDLSQLQQHLKNAPLLGTPEQPKELLLPMPDGTKTRFEVWDSPIMEAGLAAKYPNIKTFKIKSTTNSSTIGRIGYTANGFHASIDSPKGQVYIDPYATDQTQYYISYYTRDHVDVARQESFTCDLPHEEELEYIADIKAAYHDHQKHQEVQRSAASVQFREYRLALATTAQYSAYHGGTVNSVMAAVVTCMNRVNGVIERELGIHLNLIDDNDVLFFFDPTTDGYTNGNTQAMIGENPVVLSQYFLPNEYDVGHVFGTNAGGLAALASVCTNRKANGVTCHGNPIGDNFYVDYVCHELGHQFGAPHTFNLCDNDNENPATAYEPGSGSTIMSYSGLCGSNNIQFDSDDYYHIGALELEIFFMHEDDGNSCAQHSETNNNTPVADIPFEGNFFIPIRTPFELEGAATDEDGDELRYCWEQYDLGPAVNVGSPALNSPIMRSYPPTTNPTRVIPNINSLLSGSMAFGEMLPTYSRDLTFRLTVRDYNEEAGAVDWDEVAFKATDAAGPFVVEYPNVAEDTLVAGDFVEVRWDVANTDASPVSCQHVDIYLSTEGGYTFTTPLLTNTPNDGSAMVLVPDIPTNTARIKIKAADNIFFDISNRNFNIVSPANAGFAWDVSPRSQQVCLPTTATIEMETFSLLDYDSLITFEVVEGLPEGATVSFTNNEATPNEMVMLEIDMGDVTEQGIYDVLLQASAAGVDTVYRTVQLDVVSNDFSAMALNEPIDGASGVSELPAFSWATSPNADSYSIEIATSPTFGSSIIDSAEGLTGNTYSPALILEENTPYYWRVFPTNACGKGEATFANSFHTISFACTKDESIDTPINISFSGEPTLESEINVIGGGTLSDINITNIQGNHEWFSDLRATLVSPAGTEVTLFSGRCANYNGNFSFGLDDESPSSFQCPPTGGTYKPLQPLSALVGENSSGTWTLRVQDNTSGSGGALDGWELELCGNITTNPPYLVTNEAMPVNPGTGRYLSNDFLLVEDDNNEEWELVYTLVDIPQKGILTHQGEPLVVGDEFTQSSIRWGAIRYTHSGTEEETDFFRFTVRDNEGGWLGTLQFGLVMDADILINTQEVDAVQHVQVFPNPTNTLLTVQMDAPTDAPAVLVLSDANGRVLIEKTHRFTENTCDLDVSKLPSGVYFLKVALEDAFLYKKIMVQQ